MVLTLDEVAAFEQTTVCRATGDYATGGVLVSFVTERGDVPDMIVTDINLAATAPATAAVAVSELVKGVHPLWGDVSLSYGGVTETTLGGSSFLGEESASVRFDASAAEMKAALEILMPVGIVTVTRDSVGEVPQIGRAHV